MYGCCSKQEMSLCWRCCCLWNSLRHNGMSFVRLLLKAGNVALLVKIMKTPYFKNSLKNPIFEIEGSNMDQMKENYLTHMNLVLTHFCPNGVLYGCCSQRLIYNCVLLTSYYCFKNSLGQKYHLGAPVCSKIS